MTKFITYFWIFVVLGGLVFGSGAGEDKAMQSEAAVQKELLAIEMNGLDLWYGESNPTAFAQSFADKATYFDPWSGGRLDDSGIAEYLMAFMGQVPKLEYKILNPRVDLYGDTAVLTFTCNAIDPKSGAVTPWNVTNVFMHTKDGWTRVHANWNYMAAQPAS